MSENVDNKKSEPLNISETKQRIDIYYWTFDLPFSLRSEPQYITKEEFNKYYTLVATLELISDFTNTRALYDSLEYVREMFSSKEHNPILKSDAHMNLIRQNKLHTTMGMSDIIVLNNKHYCLTAKEIKFVNI